MTAFRSTTDAMLAAKFNPKPWLCEATGRRASKPTQHVCDDWIFDPRLEFIPGRYRRTSNGQLWTANRPEPNPILIAFRERSWDLNYWIMRLSNGDLPVGVAATPEQIEHARRVLTRLSHLN